MCCVLRLLPTDPPAPSTYREIAGLNLPVFDSSSDIGCTSAVDQVSEGASKEKPNPAGAAKTATPFILGEGLPPIPAKLIAKIQKGEFVDMAELLRNNIEAERRRSKENGASTSNVQAAQSRREVLDILSWVQCVGMYTAIVLQVNPEKFQQLLAYQTMLLREARRCGGAGWQTYDTMFRQQVANSLSADWSKLNSSLYAVNFLANQNRRGKTCQYCLETDHLSLDCAFAPARADRGSSRDSNKDDVRTRGGTVESVGVAAIRYVFPGMTDGVLQLHIVTIVTFALSAQESTKL